MFKKIMYILTLSLCGMTFAFGNQQSERFTPPPRKDKLDNTSPAAKQELKRAEHILANLVSDPQSYNLMLSDMSSFGGEAVAPGVYSDKPTLIVYHGALLPNRSDDEIAFMMAHELGHLNLYHNEKMGETMEKLFNGPPAGISGTVFTVFRQKQQEQEADLYGLHLYRQAGYNMDLFPDSLALIKKSTAQYLGITDPNFKVAPSLSMSDSHYSLKDRFTLLVKESKKMA